ncbi:ABC transporter substrate-binding protein [Candidatus Izimaplasma bacterium ZiA1]|uniref:ABC transporter substrate-binding protein n=1 Tax=Candidatus Izimoplasma sp. ZiA1 TaxID=2024899 RepID=UPI000BAA646E|nr:ABC transporter substrate-binding protein [Candidatus Izimaplasma bacterium ZiA1]
MKKILTITLLVLGILVMSGCQKDLENLNITDREGNEVSIPSKINRIVSTAPSNTEVLVELGLSDKIVAVDKYSPTDTLESNVTIINFRDPDAEALIALNPDIIIASGHNKVGDEDPFKLLKEAGIAVVYIPSATSLQGILDDISFIGEVTNRKTEANTVIADLQRQFDEIKTIAETITNKLNVYFEIGDYSGKLYTFGSETFLNEVVALVGGNNIYSGETSWISVSSEDIITKNPDVIITNQNYNEEIVENIKNRAGFETISAVINGKVYVVNGNKTSRGSNMIIEGIKEVAMALYPDYYDFN